MTIKQTEEEGFRIFVVEDNEWYNRLLVHYLEMDPGHEVKSFFTGTELMKHLHECPDLITLDYRLPDGLGSELVKKIRDFDETIEVIIISEQEDIQVALDLLKEGAYDYLVKNEEIRQRLHNTIGKIRDKSGLRKRIRALEKEVVSKYDFAKSVIGNSKSIQGVIELMGKAAGNAITVILSGETGTGKEVVAKAIHYNSPRRNKPFIPVNMSAIPSELFESEFFGHEKGAFTGAVARRIGKFEESNGGTLFLDEITETDLNFQPKLLRALQEREIMRIGSNEPVRFDCRLMVATNRNLQEEVKKGTLRQDLYYRLFGLTIDLPPLRERGNDVLVLARHFMETYCRDNHLPSKNLSDSACNKLLSHTWPGNVRELKSVIELAIVMCTGDSILADDIILSHPGFLSESLTEEMTLKEYNQHILRFYLNKYDRNITLVAQKLGIGQATIYRMMKER